MEKRNYGGSKPRKYGSKDSRNNESADVRKFEGELKPLMTEEEKKDAQVLELSYDFSCRIIRLYKYLNEGKLSKADRDIIGALGMQLEYRNKEKDMAKRFFALGWNLQSNTAWKKCC